MLVLHLHLALALLHQHHHLDHGGKASAVQLQAHRGELGRQAVEAEGMGVLRSSRRMNRRTLPKAKVVLYNYFLTVFMADSLAEGHCSTGLLMHFMAFDGQDDPLRSRTHSEHEVVPEFFGFFPKRRFLHLHPILWLSGGMQPRWEVLTDQVMRWVHFFLRFLPEPSKPGEHLLSLPLAFPCSAGTYQVWHCNKQIWLFLCFLVVAHGELSAFPF